MPTVIVNPGYVQVTSTAPQDCYSISYPLPNVPQYNPPQYETYVPVNFNGDVQSSGDILTSEGGPELCLISPIVFGAAVTVSLSGIVTMTGLQGDAVCNWNIYKAGSLSVPEIVGAEVPVGQTCSEVFVIPMDGFDYYAGMTVRYVNGSKFKYPTQISSYVGTASVLGGYGITV